MDAGRIGRAQQGTEVVRIFELVEQQQERRLPFRLGTREDVFDLDVRHGCNKGQHALMAVACRQRLDFRTFHCLRQDAALLHKCEQILDVMRTVALCEQDLVDATARFQRFRDGIAADEDIIRQFARLLRCPRLP